MVCRNPGDRIRTALESVWTQTTPVRLIVVDGASTDGTAGWLSDQASRIDTLISEPDAGVYDAMNKGVAAAGSGWILFLGSDDRLASSNVIAKAVAHLDQHPADVIVGSARYNDGRIYAYSGAKAAIRRNFVHHQATFYRSAGTMAPWFDNTLRLQADYDYNLRLLHSGAHFATLPVLISHCASGGISDAGRWANYREEITVRHRHFPGWRCWPWDTVSVIRYFRKILVRIAAKILAR